MDRDSCTGDAPEAPSDWATELLDFWFGQPGDPEFNRPRKIWFRKDPNFDRTIGNRWSNVAARAATGHLDAWMERVEGCLALTLALDQLPRNLYRNTPQAFASDAKARQVAARAIDRGFDRDLVPVRRWFFYLPFEHSENLADQARSLQLFQQLRQDPDSASSIDYAQRHYAIIRRFGRFPHRNAILGRNSTPEELDFLQERGSSF